MSWSLNQKLVCIKIGFAIEYNDQSMKTFMDVDLEDVLEWYGRWTLRQEIIRLVDQLMSMLNCYLCEVLLCYKWCVCVCVCVCVYASLKYILMMMKIILEPWNHSWFQLLFNFLELLFVWSSFRFVCVCVFRWSGQALIHIAVYRVW